MAEKVKVPLSQPITVGKGTAKMEVCELEFEPPKLKHLKAFDGVHLGITGGGLQMDKFGTSIIKLAAQLGNMTVEEAEEISLADLPKVAEAVLGFFGVSLPTGKSTSGQ